MCFRDGIEGECQGHYCVSCGRAFRCNQSEAHVCPARPERTQAGVLEARTESQKIAEGFAMINEAHR